MLLLHPKFQQISLTSFFLPFSQGPPLESISEETGLLDLEDVNLAGLSDAVAVALIQSLTQQENNASAEEIERIRAISAGMRTNLEANQTTVGASKMSCRNSRTQKLLKIASASASA